MTQKPLPLDLPPPAARCWYCGSSADQIQIEHQRPVSRGGRNGVTVLACARCNSLKGPLNLEEFREGIAERLGLTSAEVIFAGEATPERPTTGRIVSVRSLAAERSVVRIDPAVGEELHKAWLYLRSISGDSQITRRDLASTGIAEHLDELRERLGVG
jgi:HNH endonuclease